jgi:hypothetical protein
MDGWMDGWMDGYVNMYMYVYTLAHIQRQRDPRPAMAPHIGRGLPVPAYLAHRALAERLLADDHPRRRLEPVPLHASVLPGYSRGTPGVLPGTPKQPLYSLALENQSRSYCCFSTRSTPASTPARTPASSHLRERVGLIVRLVLQLDHALRPPLARLRQRLGGRPQVG